MGSNSNNWCPCKRKNKVFETHRHSDTEENRVKREAEIGEMHPETKDLGERAGARASSEPSKGANHADTLISDVSLPEL